MYEVFEILLFQRLVSHYTDTHFYVFSVTLTLLSCNKQQEKEHENVIRILFSQTHRQTDRFFVVSGVLSPQSDRGFFHYHHVSFSCRFKSRVGNILTKAETLRIKLILDGSSITSKSHSPFTLTNFSSFNLVFVFRCSSSTNNPVSVWCVDSSFLVFSLSSHRYSNVSLLFISLLIHNKQPHEGFSYSKVLSTFLTPYSFGVTFFTLWSCPFFILLQINERIWHHLFFSWSETSWSFRTWL